MIRLSVSGGWLGLPQDMVSDLVAGATTRSLRTGETLFRAGDVGDGCYRLDEGLLKVSLISSEAEERIIAILKPGAIVGDLAVMDGLPRSATVVAFTDCKLHFISRALFELFAHNHPKIYEHLVKVLATRLRDTDETIASLAFLSMKGRLARALLELSENLGQESDSGAIRIPYMISQRDLAAMAGVARENTNRVLTEWERMGLVTKSSGHYQINDTERLKEESDW